MFLTLIVVWFCFTGMEINMHLLQPIILPCFQSNKTRDTGSLQVHKAPQDREFYLLLYQNIDFKGL
jgi:hypothetical protein